MCATEAMMVFRTIAFRCAVAAFAAVVLFAPAAEAVVIERVVAVVGDRAIWLSELRQRVRPYLLEIQARVPTEAQRAAAESEVMRQMLNRMVEDQLQAQAAIKMQVRVDVQEVDTAIARLAQSQDMTVQQLYADVQRSGVTAQEYRLEIRRQLLEGKLLDMRVKGQVRITEEDLLAMYNRLQRDERRTLGYSPQWIVFRIGQGVTEQQRAEIRAKAERVAAQARGGWRFDELAKRFSDDSSTRGLGGRLGKRSPGELDEQIERVAMGLDVGQVSQPFRYADALVILRIEHRDPSKLGTFEQARELLAQRVYGEKLERAKERWIKGLKRRTHVEVRL